MHAKKKKKKKRATEAKTKDKKNGHKLHPLHSQKCNLDPPSIVSPSGAPSEDPHAVVPSSRRSFNPSPPQRTIPIPPPPALSPPKRNPTLLPTPGGPHHKLWRWQNVGNIVAIILPILAAMFLPHPPLVLGGPQRGSRARREQKEDAGDGYHLQPHLHQAE